MVENYENPGDYAGPFVGYNAALMPGGEHCWNPEKKYGVGTMSRSVTFSGGLGLGVIDVSGAASAIRGGKVGASVVVDFKNDNANFYTHTGYVTCNSIGLSASYSVRYYYYAAGNVTTLTYKKGTKAEVSYFYARNLQGDITAIYRNSDSELIGTYEYDLWGRPVSVKEASAGIDTDGILRKNPLRYRGYYYDEETGFYYLNARYYDPEIRRFISADDMQYLGAGDKISGYNLFAYCNNNPVMGYDPTGNWDWGGVLIGAGLMGTAVAAAVVMAVCGGPVSTPAVLATAGVFAAGAVVTYAAATDSAIAVDISGAAMTPLQPLYIKGGISAVVDFQNAEINLYPHGGAGIGIPSALSASVGLVGNYEKPDDYKGPFIGGNIGYWLGADHCWDPRKKHAEATQATSATFSSGFGIGVEGSYFLPALEIFEW